MMRWRSVGVFFHIPKTAGTSIEDLLGIKSRVRDGSRRSWRSWSVMTRWSRYSRSRMRVFVRGSTWKRLRTMSALFLSSGGTISCVACSTTAPHPDPQIVEQIPRATELVLKHVSYYLLTFKGWLLAHAHFIKLEPVQQKKILCLRGRD